MDILGGLTPTQIEIVHRCRNYRECAEGDVIFNEGEQAESMYIIMSGSVEIYRNVDKQDYRVATFSSPEVFGEMGLLTKAGRTASARATEPTLLFEVPNNLVHVMREFTGAEATMKLLVIGLDSAPPRLVFEQWRDELPTLGKLMATGAYGPLQSTHPPITVPVVHRKEEIYTAATPTKRRI